MRLQPPSISFSYSVPVVQCSSEVGAVWSYTPEHRGTTVKSTKHIIRPRGWPQTESQESARAKAMIDDEARRRFYWTRSAACRDNQNEWDPWHLWAPSPLQSHFHYYLFTYSNNVGSISAINLQTWRLNCELCSSLTKKKKIERKNGG